jgi:hypothetical protein
MLTYSLMCVKAAPIKSPYHVSLVLHWVVDLPRCSELIIADIPRDAVINEANSRWIGGAQQDIFRFNVAMNDRMIPKML